MICSKCRNNMDQGFVSSHRPMKWTEKVPKMFVFGEKITRDGSNFKIIGVHHIEAYRCQYCRKIEMYY